MLTLYSRPLASSTLWHSAISGPTDVLPRPTGIKQTSRQSAHFDERHVSPYKVQTHSPRPHTSLLSTSSAASSFLIRLNGLSMAVNLLHPERYGFIRRSNGKCHAEKICECLPIRPSNPPSSSEIPRPPSPVSWKPPTLLSQDEQRRDRSDL